ncbi:hypothetical protein [Halobacterium hubeiense]|uniref:hypothetical protein n=1 Tax=Halobacterium hubeiense TaxID=1407499 RepID=UPI003C75A775
MSRSPSSDDAEDDGASPLAAGAALWREALLAWVGLPLALAGLNGWLYFLRSENAVYRYGLADLLRDAALTFAGVYLVVLAAGSAATRLRPN